MGQLTIDSGDTAWMLISTALVMLMILPGLALFYGGLVRAKSLLSVMSQILGITAIAILTWVLWNYSLAFNGGGRFIGDLSKAGFAGITDTSAWPVGTGRKGDPRASLRRVPDEFRRDHRRPRDWSAGRTHPVRSDLAVLSSMADDRLRATGAHGLGFRWPVVQIRSDRLCRRDCRSHQFRRRRPGWRCICGIADRLSQGSDAAALACPDDGRRGAIVGWLVRVQRRVRPRGRWPRGGCDDQHSGGSGRGTSHLDGCGTTDLGQALDAGRRFGRCCRAGGGDTGSRCERPDRRHVAGHRGEPRLLRLRRLAQEPT